MQASFIPYLFILCINLMLPAAMAQDIGTSETSTDMKHEERAEFREKMRLRMEQVRAEKREQSSNKESRINSDNKETHSTYGKGFNSRLNDHSDSRPERPRFERFNRGERGRP